MLGRQVLYLAICSERLPGRFARVFPRNLARRLAAGLMLAVLAAGVAHAQDSAAVPMADTSSPRATLKSFVDACNELDALIKSRPYLDRVQDAALATRILDCLDTSELPAFAREERAGEVAVCLKEIIDRSEMPDWSQTPDADAIEAAGGLEQLSRWRLPGTRITIARVEEGPEKHEYLFSPGTVSRAVEYYKAIRSRPYRTDGPPTSPGLYKWYMSSPGRPIVAEIVSRLPDRIRFGRTLGLSNWKWPGLLLLLAFSIGAMALLYHWQLLLVGKVSKSSLAYFLTAALPLTALLIPIGFEYLARNYLTIRGTPLYVVTFGSYTVVTCAAIIMVFVGCNRVAEGIIAMPRINPQGLDAQLIRIGSRLVSLVLAVIVFIVGGQYLGIPIGTLLASAGIGGIALALGFQDTLKTLFGTIMLLADKPFRVGERIRFKGYDGVVEDIGLRSTRLRLLDSHQVTVPNDELARSDIENIGRRQYIRRVADFHLPLETPYSKLQAAVTILRRRLENHEGMHEDYPPRVYLLDIADSAFTLRSIYWYHPPSYWEYLAFSEKFNLSVLQEFESAGIKLTVPQRITHTSLDSQEQPVEVKMLGGGAG